MSVEPSAAQLAALRDGDPAERIALVRLLRAKDPAAYARWHESLAAALAAAGGRRVYQGVVDGVLTADDFAADELLIDEFPSRELAAESLRLANPHSESALAEALVLATRPRRIPGLSMRAAGLWLRLTVRRARADRAPFLDSGNRAIDPEPAALESFFAKQPERPLFVLNLNLHRDRAAYARYGRSTLPELLRRRAGPVFWGEGSSVVVGAAAHSLAVAWSEILLVRYPTRAAMGDMLQEPAYQRGLPQRELGLSRACLVATGSGDQRAAAR